MIDKTKLNSKKNQVFRIIKEGNSYIEKTFTDNFRMKKEVEILKILKHNECKVPEIIEINEQTGYRYYDIKQSAKLDMINYMKATGMSLKDIKGVFDNHDLSKLTITLEKHLDTLDNQINDLKQQKKAIKKMIDSYNR